MTKKEIRPYRGAPRGNKNATRHGLRAGALPRGGAYVQRDTNLLRCEIERAVLAKHGQIDLYKAAVIQTAIRWERHAMLAQRWLRNAIEDMDAMQRLNYSREIGRASDNRDRCLKELALDVNIGARYALDPATGEYVDQSISEKYANVDRETIVNALVAIDELKNATKSKP